MQFEKMASAHYATTKSIFEDWGSSLRQFAWPTLMCVLLWFLLHWRPRVPIQAYKKAFSGYYICIYKCLYVYIYSSRNNLHHEGFLWFFCGCDIEACKESEWSAFLFSTHSLLNNFVSGRSFSALFSVIPPKTPNNLTATHTHPSGLRAWYCLREYRRLLSFE